MMSANVTVLKDGNGIEREYVEVERKANVGERIKIVDAKPTGMYNGYVNGDTFTVDSKEAEFVGTRKYGDELRFWHSEYTVLEPTDIVRIDGVRYREEKRKANVGDRILIVREDCTGRFKIGEVYRIDATYDYSVLIDHPKGTNRGRAALDHDDYVTLTPISKNTTQPTVSDRITELERRVSELEAQLAPKQISVSIPKFDAEATAEAIRKAIAKVREQTKPQKSPQELRDEIVERAKADVVELTVRSTFNYTADEWFHPNTDAVSYVVNREKRAVVALVKRKYSNKVWAIGIAKCTPGDVFNSHIGRAISLRRALGIEVPTEYYKAPAPTEVRVGDVVRGGQIDGYYTPEKTFTLTKDIGDETFKYAETPTDWIERYQIGVIIDDSRE